MVRVKLNMEENPQHRESLGGDTLNFPKLLSELGSSVFLRTDMEGQVFSPS